MDLDQLREGWFRVDGRDQLFVKSARASKNPVTMPDGTPVVLESKTQVMPVRSISRTLRVEVRFSPSVQFKHLFGASNDLRVAANRLIEAYHLVDRGRITAEAFSRKDGRKKTTGLANRGYEAMTGEWKPFGSAIYAPTDGPEVGGAVKVQTARFVKQRFDEDRKEMQKGNRHLATFTKADFPIVLPEQAVRLVSEGKHFAFRLQMWAANQDETGGCEVVCHPVKGVYASADKCAVLDRLASNTYKMGAVSLKYNRRRSKWFLNISWTGEVKIAAGSVIAGVDLGMRTTVALGYVDRSTGASLRYQDFINIPHDVRRTYERVRQEKRERGRTTRAELELRSGRGVQRKIRPVSSIQDKYKRLTDTVARQIAAAVVKAALRRGAMAIALEDLRFSPARSQDEAARRKTKAAGARLNTWHFKWLRGKLHQCIQVAAESAGLEFMDVEARGTSRTCSACGAFYEVRDDEFGRDGAWFKCRCGLRMNADANAGRNIAKRGHERLDSLEAPSDIGDRGSVEKGARS